MMTLVTMLTFSHVVHPDPLRPTTEAFAQLDADLTFLRQSDEYADISHGVELSDSSLVDEILSDANNDHATAAQEETNASEAQTQSYLHQYLSSILNKIKKDIYLHKQPNCYATGDFVIRPKHAVFALHDAAVSGLQPDHLALRDVFVWLPKFLPGAPEFFKCTCGSRLTKNGVSIF